MIDNFALQALIDFAPTFIERHWPKNETAAHGGPKTPGRGEAMAVIGMFIAELPLADRQRSIADYCTLALTALGTASSLEVREWLKQRGIRFTPNQIRGALNGLARRTPPVAELIERSTSGRGMPGFWRLSA